MRRLRKHTAVVRPEKSVNLFQDLTQQTIEFDKEAGELSLGGAEGEAIQPEALLALDCFVAEALATVPSLSFHAACFAGGAASRLAMTASSDISPASSQLDCFGWSFSSREARQRVPALAFGMIRAFCIRD
jgi:hypothetical protein